MYQNFIGIDISKKDYSVAVQGKKAVCFYPNTKEGFEAFYEVYKAILKTGLVALETTGGYELSLISYLQERAVAVHRANTRKVKYFIRSLGRLGKSDAIDALGLAAYGFERQA